MLPLLMLLSTEANAQEMKNITTEVVDVKDVTVDLSGAHFTVVLEMTRHGGPPTKLKQLDYQIVVADEVVGVATYDEQVKLKKGESVQLMVPVDVGINAGPALMRSIGSGNASVTIQGEAKIRVLIFPQTRPFITTYTL